jgi:GDP-L-fucose synthase
LDSKNCDLTRGNSLADFNNKKYDQIYHLAAWTQAGDFCLHHAGEQWVINQKININVLSWWQESQPQAKLICMGTSCAYDPNLPLKEENYLKGKPIDSLFAYAMTKRMLYAGLLALNKQFGLKYLCLVPSTLYGPGYHTDGRQMHFIFDLIRKILRGKNYGEEVVLWGDGYQKRELVYIDDFVEIMLKLNKTCDNELINIGAGREFSIRYFAKTICNMAGFDFKAIKFDREKYTGAKSKCLNVVKMKKKLSGFKMTSLEEGIRNTIIGLKKRRG